MRPAKPVSGGKKRREGRRKGDRKQGDRLRASKVVSREWENNLLSS